MVLEPDSDGRVPLDQATHIIANSIDFEQYNEAIEMMLPVITSTWITHSLSRGKLAQIRPFSPDPRMIFASVNLTCADIPQGDKEAITGATLALGGMASKDLSRLTTHICALSMDHDKCKEAMAKKLRCKIVLPHWFDDCFKLGKKIDETPYLLPDPSILRARGTAGDGDEDDKVPIPENQDLEGATSTLPDALPNLGWRSNLTVFQNKMVMLAEDLEMGNRFRAVVVDLVRRGGGRVLIGGEDDVGACDMYICQYRDGDDYVRAAQARKDIGNLAWLFHIITNNEWCSPLRRLLHYPVPRNGIPGFEDFVITLSNYGGEARIYLENLVVAAGAKFTKTMRMDNTHLITARDNSEKCEAARDWNIQMVNHLWIEESYARCEVQSITNPRYTTFPARTNLGEVIGQTFFDEPRLRALYYPGGADEDIGAPAETLETAKKNGGGRRKKAVQLDDEPKVLMDAPAQNGQLSSASGTNDGADTASTASEAEEEDENPPRRAALSRNALATPARPRKSSAGVAAQIDKENGNTSSPIVVGSASRSAKDKALTKLHGLVPDIALYEKEKKRSHRDGNAPWGGKRATDQVDKQRRQKAETSEAARKKRHSSESGDGDGSAEDDAAEQRPAKKSRPSLPAVQMRIVLTGYQRWVQHISKEEADRVSERGHCYGLTNGKNKD